jgi:hypothetical protein
MKIDPLEKVRLNKRIEQAHACMMDGDAHGARKIFQELLLQNPQYSAVLHGMGVLCAGQGKVDEAEPWPGMTWVKRSACWAAERRPLPHTATRCNWSPAS